MKFNFRKISAIAVSALMTGMTMGVAAAANYPAPFVSGGVADVAVVYGTGAGVSSLDQVQAGNIQESLGTYVEGGVVTVEGGESFKLEKTSNMFNLGDDLDAVYTDLDDEDMDFLADGTYDDGDIDTDYTQTITLGDQTLTFFADSDYNDKEPTIGFHFANGDDVLEYDIEFDDAIPFADLEDTDLPLMGNTYYVLDVATNNETITLLDSAEKVVVTEGESVVVGDKTVSIEWIDSTDVKFNVDGTITEKLSDHEFEELDDGSYIVANEVMYNEKESGISSVEFSIGAGKIELIHTEDVELNDEDVDGVVATFTGVATGLTNINIAWTSDGETFLTEEDALTMPLFESVKLVFGGMNFPEDPETISLENGETMTLKMGNYDLPIFRISDSNASSATLGDDEEVLVTATASAANYTGNTTKPTFPNTGGLDLIEDNKFLVTVNDTDLSDVETLYYALTSIDFDDSDNFVVNLEDQLGTKDLEFDDFEDKTVGDVTISLIQVNDTHVYLKFSGATLNYNVAYSDKGLRITLPAKTGNQTNDVGTGVDVSFQEANEDDDLGAGYLFTATVKSNENEKLHVSTDSVDTLEDSEDVYVGYALSNLASKINANQASDEYDFEIEYYGAEVTADVSVVAGGTVSSGSNVLGDILVTDAEVASVSDKNLIVVGGSCINSAAAALVGGAKCGADWTAATEVGAGQFLIKGYASSTITDKVALLVAGYEAADTVKATTALLNEEIDTSKSYKGTTSTGETTVLE